MGRVIRADRRGPSVIRADVQAAYGAKLIELERERKRALGEVEQQALEVAMLTAKRIVGQELQTRPELILDILRGLLDRLPDTRTVRVRLHPDDRNTVAASALAEDLDLVDDPSITRGGCLVLSNQGNLDARVEVQLERLAEALGGADARTHE